MGLNSFWNEDGNLLTTREDGFHCRSTGCSCCAVELDTESEVRKHAVESLMWVMRAAWYFKWNFTELKKEANKEWRELKKKYGDKE